MPKIVEMRFIIPIDITQYEKGSIYAVGRRTREESRPSEGGIETVTAEPVEASQDELFEELHYDIADPRKTFHTFKIFHYRSKIPKAWRWAVPSKYGDFHEESFSRFPVSRTCYRVPALSADRFKCRLDSQHLNYREFRGELLDPKADTVIYPDLLLSDPKRGGCYAPLDGFECPAVNISRLTSQGFVLDESKPPGWVATYPGPLTIVVKVLHVEAHLFGLGGVIERYLVKTTKETYLATARAIVEWAPLWSAMSEAELSAFLMDSYRSTIEAMRSDPTWHEEPAGSANN